MRRRPPPSPERIAAQTKLGAHPNRMRAILSRPSLEEARVALDELKVEVKKTFKRLALELHPDRHDDPEKAEELKLLSDVKAALLDLKIEEMPRLRPPVMRPQPQGTVIHIVIGAGFGPSPASTYSSTAGPTWTGGPFGGGWFRGGGGTGGTGGF